MLKLAQQLRQLQPWRLDSLAEILRQNYGLPAQVLQLIQTHFPNLLESNHGELIDVESALSTFLHAVHKEWFPLDWDYIDLAYRLYVELSGEEEGEPCFLELLDGIPVECFIPYSDFIDSNEEWHENRIYALLNCLMNGSPAPDVVAESEWFDSDFVPSDFRAAILNYDSKNDPEPFNYLSQIAVLLTADHPYEQNPFLNPMGRPMGEYPVSYYTWEYHIPRIKTWWAEAKPLTEMMSNFHDYLEDKISLDETLIYLWSLYDEHRATARNKSPRLVDVFATTEIQ